MITIVGLLPEGDDFHCPVCGQGSECGFAEQIEGVWFCAECVRDWRRGTEPELVALMRYRIQCQRNREILDQLGYRVTPVR